MNNSKENAYSFKTDHCGPFAHTSGYFRTFSSGFYGQHTVVYAHFNHTQFLLDHFYGDDKEFKNFKMTYKVELRRMKRNSNQLTTKPQPGIILMKKNDFDRGSVFHLRMIRGCRAGEATFSMEEAGFPALDSMHLSHKTIAGQHTVPAQ